MNFYECYWCAFMYANTGNLKVKQKQDAKEMVIGQTKY
jgi:hypothetical protein